MILGWRESLIQFLFKTYNFGFLSAIFLLLMNTRIDLRSNFLWI